MEKLVAELGGAFLSADFNLTPEVREVHAAYIGSWIKTSKNVKRGLFTTCSYAQKAAEYLRSLQPICGEAPAASPQDRGLQLVG
ncbi:antirestriction protein ArdC [Bradyrhizobium sp. USDA 3240]|uniref:zincin-like metallopeptidase domain-containing protein n=1 Tax=Bradyrhizobium sp. 41S5 TaxID=1404443 RepID=UPI001E42081A|nr:zincin-like metallopeptidase domain-containing protein [Bradyrhizobium sp. 41S5]